MTRRGGGGSRRRLAPIAAALAGLAAISVAAPVADARARHHVRSFSGSCYLPRGRVVFQPPLSVQPQAVTDHVHARGRCRGTYTDRRGRRHRVDGTTVRWRTVGYGDPLVCAGGISDGPGVLRFRWGTLPFHLDARRAAIAAFVVARGTRGGRAPGTVSVNPGEDLAALAQLCLGGGVARTVLDVRFATVTPLRS